MARDWSKLKSRELGRQAVSEERQIINELARSEPHPTKDELRAQASAALADYRGPIRKLPMFAALRCRSCGHRGTARVPPGLAPAFRCSNCGSSLVAWHV